MWPAWPMHGASCSRSTTAPSRRSPRKPCGGSASSMSSRRRSMGCPALDLTFIHAREARKPRGRERIEWNLVTDLPVTSAEDAVEKLQWYAQRWKIELFHKILKSGCHVEAARLRTWGAARFDETAGCGRGHRN